MNNHNKLTKTETVFAEIKRLDDKNLYFSIKNTKRGVNGPYYIPWMQNSILHISLDL